MGGRKGASAYTAARERAAVAWQWWQPEGKTKRRMGSHVPLPFPPRRSLQELFSTQLYRRVVRRRREGQCLVSFGEGKPFPHWLQGVKFCRQCPIPAFPPLPPTPKHLSIGPVIHAHVARSPMNTNVFTPTLSWKGNWDGKNFKC